MKCKKCGNELHSNDSFCIKCGEPVSEDNTVHKKSKKKIIIPIVAVCAVLLIIVIVAVSNSGNKNEISFDSSNQNYNDYEYQTSAAEISTENSTEVQENYNPIGKETLQYPSQDDTFTYDVYETYAEVTGSVDDSLSGKITIPETFDDLPILSIKSQAFLYNSKITELKLPNNLYQICPYAFKECSSLTIVEFGNGLEKIYDYAFSETNIKTINTPNSVNELGEYSFARCDNLIEVILSDNITNIPVGLFDDDLNLKKIEFPSSLISIDDDSFIGTGFDSLILPDSLQTIGEWTFSHMNNIKEFTIPDSVTEIGEGVLANCDSLEKVTVGKNIGHIPNWAFAGCAELKELVILPNVVNISDLILNENAIYNNGDLYSHPTIYGEKGSNAASFASSKGLVFKFIEN